MSYAEVACDVDTAFRNLQAAANIQQLVIAWENYCRLVLDGDAFTVPEIREP